MNDTELSLALVAASNPFPTITEDGELRDGVIICQPKICTKCKDKECANLDRSKIEHSVEHFICPRGMSLFAFRFPFGILLSNGLIEMSLNFLRTGATGIQNQSQCRQEKQGSWQHGKILNPYL